MTYNPVCECCHMRPKMDRCDCCEECWYSGRWSASRWRSVRPDDYAPPLATKIASGEIEAPDEFVMEDRS